MTPSEIRARVMAVAQKEVGYTETGGSTGHNGNITKYWAALKPGFQGSPWCGALATWAVKEALGVDASTLFNSYYTPAIVRWARSAGAWKTSAPEPGDWVLMNFPGGDFVDHVGLVESGRSHIEGNTSPDSSGSQANGGGVYRRTRPGYQIVGYLDLIRLVKALGVEVVEAVRSYGWFCTLGTPYAADSIARRFGISVAQLQSLNPSLGITGPDYIVRGYQAVRVREDSVPAALPAPGGTVKKGSKGADVVRLQKALGITADGEAGPQTDWAIRNLQRRAGLIQDGEAGPKTWAAIATVELSKQ